MQFPATTYPFQRFVKKNRKITIAAYSQPLFITSRPGWGKFMLSKTSDREKKKLQILDSRILCIKIYTYVSIFRYFVSQKLRGAQVQK